MNLSKISRQLKKIERIIQASIRDKKLKILSDKRISNENSFSSLFEAAFRINAVEPAFLKGFKGSANRHE